MKSSTTSVIIASSLVLLLVLFTSTINAGAVVFEKRDDSQSQLLNGWQLCGSANDGYSVENATISPDPPVAGGTLTITVNGTLVDTVQNANVIVTVYYMGLIRLARQDIDLCEKAKENPTSRQCPVTPGPYLWVQSADLPTDVPSGTYTIKAQGTYNNGQSLFCLQYSFSV